MVVKFKWRRFFWVKDGTPIFLYNATVGKANGRWMYSNDNVPSNAEPNI